MRSGAPRKMTDFKNAHKKWIDCIDVVPDRIHRKYFKATNNTVEDTVELENEVPAGQKVMLLHLVMLYCSTMMMESLKIYLVNHQEK